MLPYYLLPQKIIHVGANRGQEEGVYSGLNINVLWIEPLIQHLNAIQYGYKLCCAIGPTPGLRKLILASNAGASSSFYPMKEHKRIFPNIKEVGEQLVPVLPLRMVQQHHPDRTGLVIDVQGAELEVLESTNLTNITHILVETNTREMYENGETYTKVRDMLLPFYEVSWEEKCNLGQADTLFVRKSCQQ